MYEKEKYLHTIEFDEVQKLLADEATLLLAKDKALSLRPFDNFYEVKNSLQMTEDAYLQAIVERKGIEKDGDGGRFTEDGKTYTRPTTYLPATGRAADKADRIGHATMEVIGSGSGQTWIGLYMNGSRCGTDTATGDVDFILDNLKITEVEGAEIVTVSATDLLLGETANIYGSSLDKIEWTMSVEGVVELDTTANTIRAIGAGTTVLTATFPSGKTESFTFTVEAVQANGVDGSGICW